MSRTPSVNRAKRIINPYRSLDTVSAKNITFATYPWLRLFAPKKEFMFEYWLMETCLTIDVFTLTEKAIAKLGQEYEYMHKCIKGTAFRDTVIYSKGLFVFY